MAKQSSRSGVKWSPERRAKFMATVAAKRHGSEGLRADKTQLILARKLKRQVVESIRDTGEVGDLQLTALALVNGILGTK